MVGCGVLIFSPLVVDDTDSVVVGDDAGYAADVDAVELDFVVDLVCLFDGWGDVPAPGGIGAEGSSSSWCGVVLGVFTGEPGDGGC